MFREMIERITEKLTKEAYFADKWRDAAEITPC